MAGVGPMFGQFGFFHKFAGKDIEDKRPLNRYRDESKRLLGVLEKRLEGRQWIMGDDYTIADIATFPWVRGAKIFYEVSEVLGFDQLPNVSDWLDRAIALPLRLGSTFRLAGDNNWEGGAPSACRRFLKTNEADHLSRPLRVQQSL